MALMKMLSALIFMSFEKSSVPMKWVRSLTVKRSVSGDWGDVHQQADFAFGTEMHCLPLRAPSKIGA